MKVYDCDDPAQFESLSGAVSEMNLEGKNLLQAFAPDEILEAANRGFKPVEPTLPRDTSHRSD